MGFQTTLVIKNDAINDIDSDPKGWWQETMSQIQGFFGKNPKSYGFGSHSNGFEVASVHHADVTSVIAVGQNHSTVLGQYWHQHHHTEEAQVEILKKMAKEHGYKLVKETAKKKAASTQQT